MFNRNKYDAHKQEHDTAKKRAIDNQKILAILADYLRKNPEMRFNQALINLNIVQSATEFYAEPEEILKRIK